MSKENNVLELFFNESSRQWHFEEIIKESRLSRDKVNKWLTRFIKEGLIKRIKEKGKMPYYAADFENPSYKNRKKLYALSQLYKTGFLNHIMELKQAKTIILFGSFARSDWYKNSDIDIFIYGDSEGLSLAKYELKLHRDIQLFICQNKKELKKLGQGLVKNIINGMIIKGNIDFVEVGINA